VARTAHFALHRCALDAQPDAVPLFPKRDVWIGAMVPKRWARRAVTRNAIKRQIYGMSAAVGASLPPAAHLVRLRSAVDRQEFQSASSDKLNAAVRAELQVLLERAAVERTAS
jgi:ribonuclease P protein component